MLFMLHATLSHKFVILSKQFVIPTKQSVILFKLFVILLKKCARSSKIHFKQFVIHLELFAMYLLIRLKLFVTPLAKFVRFIPSKQFASTFKKFVKAKEILFKQIVIPLAKVAQLVILFKQVVKAARRRRCTRPTAHTGGMLEKLPSSRRLRRRSRSWRTC